MIPDNRWPLKGALLGDEPIEGFGEYLQFAVEQLGTILNRRRRALGTDAVFLDDLHVLLIGLSRIANDDPNYLHRLQFVRRKVASNQRERARKEHLAAERAEDLMADGRDTESAVADARQATGIGRGPIFDKLKERRENGLAEIVRKVRKNSQNSGPSFD